jgi:hypothetical protein
MPLAAASGPVGTGLDQFLAELASPGSPLSAQHAEPALQPDQPLPGGRDGPPHEPPSPAETPPSGTGPPAAAPTAYDEEKLTDRLYEQIRIRLASELLIDRERSAQLFDP